MKSMGLAMAFVVTLIGMSLPGEIRANSATYNFSGTLANSFNGGNTVSGYFTLDTTTATVSAFDFSVPGVTVLEVCPACFWVPNVTTFTPATNPMEDFVEIDFSFIFHGDLILLFQSDLSDFTGSNFDVNAIEASPGVMIQSEYSCPNLIVCQGTFTSPFVQATVTPEPSSLVLFGTGFLILAAISWQRKVSGATNRSSLDDPNSATKVTAVVEPHRSVLSQQLESRMTFF